MMPPVDSSSTKKSTALTLITSPSTKKTPAHEQSSRAASSATVARSSSSASAIQRRAVVGRDLDRSPRLRVDEDEGLVGGDEERSFRHLEGCELEGHARSSDLRDSDADLELVVEPGGGE